LVRSAYKWWRKWFFREDILKRETRERLEEEAQQEAYQEDPSRGGNDFGGSEEIDRFMRALSGQESGGDSSAVNSLSGAEGTFQILPSNWSAWADEAGIGPDAPKTAENQTIVARHKLLDYYSQYGNWQDVASLWYSGEPLSKLSEEEINRPQPGGPSIGEYVNSVMGRMSGDTSNAPYSSPSSPTTPTNNAMGDLPQDSEMVRYCKIVSEKTGVRADFILAQLISESGWDMLNQHKPGYNYGNAGDGGYATFNSLEEAANFMADHSIAYAKDRQALAAAANRGDAAAFVHILAQNGYFTTLESKYLATFESVLAQLKNRGVNLGAFGAGDLSGLLKNFKPKSLSEQAADNAKRFASALQSMGISSGKTAQGRIVDGMYVDIGSKFESIDDIRKRYQEMGEQTQKHETYISKAQQATDEAAKNSLKQVSDATKANLKSQQDTMEMSMREMQKQKMEKAEKQENVAMMAITGKTERRKNE
jgi:hypothetical protein